MIQENFNPLRSLIFQLSAIIFLPYHIFAKLRLQQNSNPMRLGTAKTITCYASNILDKSLHFFQ